MSDELEKYAIETDQVIDPDFDLVELREKGISLIQKYSGTAWTDHNIHDPGITILEQLCLAISDISYQTEHVIDATGNTAFENSPYFDFALATNTNPLITFKDFTDTYFESPYLNSKIPKKIGCHLEFSDNEFFDNAADYYYWPPGHWGFHQQMHITDSIYSSIIDTIPL